MSFGGILGAQSIYNREVDIVRKIVLPTVAGGDVTATVALADLGLATAVGWAYAEQVSGWEVTNLETKTNFHACAIVGANLVISEGTDQFETGETLYVRISSLPLVGGTPTMS